MSDRYTFPGHRPFFASAAADAGDPALADRMGAVPALTDLARILSNLAASHGRLTPAQLADFRLQIARRLAFLEATAEAARRMVAEVEANVGLGPMPFVAPAPPAPEPEPAKPSDPPKTAKAGK